MGYIQNMVARISPHSKTDVEYLFVYLERLGGIDRSLPKGKVTLQTIYVIIVHSVLWFYNGCHLLSTLTRSIRYQPECFQVIYEDSTSYGIMFFMYYFQYYRQDIEKMLAFMKNSFSRADMKIVERHDYQGKRFFLILSVFIGIVAFSSVTDALTPLTAKDIAIRAMVYRVNHPERHHQYNVLVPYVDETDAIPYVIIFLWEVYVNFMLAAFITLAIIIVPILLLHLQGQYEILSSYVLKIGRIHTDEAGREIFYTNIETNEFQYARQDEATSSKYVHTQHGDYQRSYLKQIVRFHRKLLDFQDQVQDLIAPLMLSVVALNMALLSLCLYEVMVFSPASIGQARYTKFFVQTIAVMVEYYFICNMSELADDCNRQMQTALIDSGWNEMRENDLRRDVGMVYRRVEGPNHLTFNKGILVLSRVLFVDVVKLSYSFCNFMRLGDQIN